MVISPIFVLKDIALRPNNITNINQMLKLLICFITNIILLNIKLQLATLILDHHK